MKKSPRPQTQASQIRRWRAHLDAQAKSGLSRAEYCRQHNLPYHAFGYWQGKLRRPESHPLTLVPLTLQPGPMQPTANSDLPALRLLLPGKIAVAVGDGFSPVTLDRLLSFLETR